MRMMVHCQQIRMQCLSCGRAIGNAIAHNKVHPQVLAALPPFDEHLRDDLFNQQLKAQATINRQRADEIEQRLKDRRRAYNEHLASQEWRELRERVIEREQGICQGCRRAAIQEVHHLTYDRLGDELLTDLVGVCRACHLKFHPDKQ